MPTMTAHSEILSWLACVTSDSFHNPADDDNLDHVNPKPDLQAESHLPSPRETTPSHTASLRLAKRRLMSDRGAPTPKRPRRAITHTRDERDGSGDGHESKRDDDGEDRQETPRASGRVRKKNPTKAPSTAPSVLSNRSSQLSYQSGSGSRSPTKRMAAMELQPDGVETRSFSLTDSRLPASLVGLLVEMEACGHGAGVVSPALKVRSSSSTLRVLHEGQLFIASM